MRKTEARRRMQANGDLLMLPSYHRSIPIQSIDEILNAHGFRPLEPAIYCGREGRSTEQVGDRTWLHMTWHKMEVTGNYEIVLYLS